jgi:endonuclease III
MGGCGARVMTMLAANWDAVVSCVNTDVERVKKKVKTVQWQKGSRRQIAKGLSAVR